MQIHGCKLTFALTLKADIIRPRRAGIGKLHVLSLRASGQFIHVHVAVVQVYTATKWSCKRTETRQRSNHKHGAEETQKVYPTSAQPTIKCVEQI